MSDNFGVEVRSCGREHFEAAVRLAWGAAPSRKATHYVAGLPDGICLKCSGTGKRSALLPNKDRIDYFCPRCKGTGKSAPQSAMVLLWHEDRIRGVAASKLPFPLAGDAAVSFLWDWLQGADYPNEPDTDGSVKKGYIVTTGDFWGHVEGSHYTVLGVYPDWQMFGK